ncbi:MAG: glutathione S-transferase N-terminal domain-containing protein [Byssovorax sp.]
MNRTLDVATSAMATLARLGAGARVSSPGKQPAKVLELYEFEACPYCRKVREALSRFDLDAKIYPCPRGGRFREEVKARGGKLQFPFLVDPNNGTEMYESDDIIQYLADTYRDGKVPFTLGPLTILSGGFAAAFRAGKGRKVRPAHPPEKPLEIWSYEASVYSRLAREALNDLEIPYLLHNVAGKSAGREAFKARSGKMMVPYLVDPNTGKEMFESADIVAYLEATYSR